MSEDQPVNNPTAAGAPLEIWLDPSDFFVWDERPQGVAEAVRYVREAVVTPNGWKHQMLGSAPVGSNLVASCNCGWVGYKCDWENHL